MSAGIDYTDSLHYHTHATFRTFPSLVEFQGSDMRSLINAVVCLLLPSSLLLAQSTPQDPFLGGYMLANSAEITYVHAGSTGTTLSRRFWDCDTTSGILIAGPTSLFPDSSGIGAGRFMDVVAGDFDGDAFDEVITAWAGGDRTLFLAVEAPRRSGGGVWEAGSRNIVHSLSDIVQSNLHLVRGNFDLDPEAELLVGYWAMNGNIVLVLYDVSSSLELTRTASLPAVTYGSIAAGIAQFHLAAGDFDKDGLDEVVMVRTVAGTPVDIRCSVYDYYWPAAMFNPGADVLVNLRDIGNGAWRDDFVLTTGDYDDDGADEAIVLYQEGYWGSLFIMARVDLIMLPISVSPNLDALVGEAGTMCDTWQASEDIPPGGGVSIVSDDFDMTGGDEVIVAGLSHVSLWQMTTWPAFALRASTAFNTRSGEESRRMISIADLNGSASQASWTPEVVVADYVSSTWFSTAAGTARVRTLGVNIDTLTTPHSITGFISKGEQQLTSVDVSRYALATGDFDGDAIRLRTPRLITKEKFVQPLVILNVPPTHYDILDGAIYDVCKQYPGNYSFKATYVKGSSTTGEFSTQQTQDWSTSMSIGGTFKQVLGLNFSRTCGESFSKKTESGSTIQITDEVFTSGDDYIFASVSEYAFWEYPLYAAGEDLGSVLVSIPKLTKLEWLPSKSPEAFHFEPSHEVGNVLSYMTAPELGGCFDIESIVCADFQGYTVSEKAGKTWEVFLSQSQGTEQEWTKSVGTEVGASLSGWGIELGVKRSYSSKEVTIHKSKATRDVKITLEVGEPDASIGMADYSVTPVVYWSTTGALVVDYATEPKVWQFPDTSLRTWWQRHYQTYPDPALLLPWRYDPEKTGDTVSIAGMRNLTKSLRLSPSVAHVGDTIKVSVRVYNYSLVATLGPVAVRFYVGDPDSGGLPLVGLGGMTEFTTGTALPARGSSMITTYGVVSGENLPAATRIYAVLDPGREIVEITEENNDGWTILTILEPVDVEDDEVVSVPDQYRLDQNYPNPFNPVTVIRYWVRGGGASPVRLAVYDLLGREVSVLVNEQKTPGMHSVVFDGCGLSTGVYLYRIQAGEYSETRKLVLLR